MPRFEGEYKETFTVDAPIDVAKKHFGDLDTIAKHYGDLQSHEKVDDETLSFVLTPRSEKGVTFHGKYTAKYEFTSDDTLEWKTVKSDNMWSKGKAVFKSLGDNKTQIDYWQHIETEMQVNRLLAKVIKGIVRSQISAGVGAYIKRMRAAIPKG